jgi:hypothetical protein
MRRRIASRWFIPLSQSALGRLTAMAKQNEVLSGPIIGSVVVAGIGNTISANLRVDPGATPSATADHVDIHAAFAEFRKILEQLQTPNQGRSGGHLTMPARSLRSRRQTRLRLAARLNAPWTMLARWRIWVTKRSSSHHTSTTLPRGWVPNGRTF